MNLKTWFEYWPMAAFFGLMPFLAGVLPTREFNGRYYGGGIIREKVINFSAQFLPTEQAENLINAFMNSTATGEFILYLPFAVNIALLSLWVSYPVGNTVMSINNWFITQSYQARRVSAKG